MRTNKQTPAMPGEGGTMRLYPNDPDALSKVADMYEKLHGADHLVTEYTRADAAGAADIAERMAAALESLSVTELDAAIAKLEAKAAYHEEHAADLIRFANNHFRDSPA